MATNLIVYLVGFAGTGKLTIAKALAPLLNARIVDNQWVNNPIFGLMDNDRLTPFPAGVWDQIAKVRDAVLETVATLSSRDANFIFTHEGVEGDPDDREIYGAIRATSNRRGAVFVPIRLLCSEAEIVRRVVSPERAERLKSMNAEAAAVKVRTHVVLKPSHSHVLTLDTTHVQPQESAELILRHIESCCAGTAPKPLN